MSSPNAKRTLVTAAATVGIMSAVWGAVMPPSDSLTDQGRQRELQREYREVVEARERQRRQLVRLGVDAEIAESQRPAEIRRAEARLGRLDARVTALAAERAAASKTDDAARAARGLLRRP